MSDQTAENGTPRGAAGVAVMGPPEDWVPAAGWDQESQVERNGIWIGSRLGLSFHCRCGWVSFRLPTHADVRWHLAFHIEREH